MEKKYLFGVILTVLLFSLIPNTFANSIDDIIEQQKQKQWQIGNGLISGDSFTYRICDDKTFSKSYFAEKCYTAKFDFYGLFDGHKGKTWIVQLLISTDKISKHGIFQIDPNTFEITTDNSNLEFSKSIQNTLFSIKKFANPTFPKILQIGETWGTVPSYLTMDADVLVLNEDTIQIGPKIFEVFTVGYNVKEQSTYSISKQFPFPLRSHVYSPTVIYPESDFLFSFELIKYNLVETINSELEIQTDLDNIESPDDFVLIDDGYSENFDDFSNYEDLICVSSEFVKLNSTGSIIIDDNFIKSIQDVFED